MNDISLQPATENRQTLERRALPDESPRRLDRWLAEKMPDHSRAFIQRLIRDKRVLVNGRIVKPSYTISPGDFVSATVPPPEKMAIEAESIPLDILYEDSDLLVVNKSANMVVHPAHGNWEGTLVNALLSHCADLSGIGGMLRPGIVHRLDKGTSGLLIVAKNDQAHKQLSLDLKNRRIHRTYNAILWGTPEPPQGTIDLPIGRSKANRKKMAVNGINGREAKTDYRVMAGYDCFSFVELVLHSGRTHQIRVHVSELGHPVLKDPLYGGGRASRIKTSAVKAAVAKMEGFGLHAAALEFIHPVKGEKMTFAAPVPERMSNVLSASILQKLF